MALVHEKLYKAKDLSRVNLRDYVTDLARFLLESYHVGKEKASLLLDIADIQVSIDTITPCGLVLNELMTNALKYAFPGDRAGKIEISARSHEDGTVELRFSDDGVGFPDGVDFKNPKSLGLKIISGLVESQMNGHVSVSNAKGLEFVIKFREKDASRTFQ